ncbi:hypothetical protein GCM10020331_071780 [Ectobacillus funiculus]
MDEEPGGQHHYRTISYDKALKAIQRLDELVDRTLNQREYVNKYEQA